MKKLQSLILLSILFSGCTLKSSNQNKLHNINPTQSIQCESLITQEEFTKLPKLIPPPDSIDMLVEWNKLQALNKNHHFLQSLVGRYNVEVRTWLPNQELPEISEAKSIITSINQGRFIEEEFKGKFHEASFIGKGITGFNNTIQKFESIWTDSMATNIEVSRGDLLEDKLVLYTSNLDSFSKEKTKKKSILVKVDKDRFVIQNFDLGDGKSEAISVEMVYRKLK